MLPLFSCPSFKINVNVLIHLTSFTKFFNALILEFIVLFLFTYFLNFFEVYLLCLFEFMIHSNGFFSFLFLYYFLFFLPLILNWTQQIRHIWAIVFLFSRLVSFQISFWKLRMIILVLIFNSGRLTLIILKILRSLPIPRNGFLLQKVIRVFIKSTSINQGSFPSYHYSLWLLLSLFYRVFTDNGVWRIYLSINRWDCTPIMMRRDIDIITILIQNQVTSKRLSLNKFITLLHILFTVLSFFDKHKPRFSFFKSWIELMDLLSRVFVLRRQALSICNRLTHLIVPEIALRGILLIHEWLKIAILCSRLQFLPWVLRINRVLIYYIVTRYSLLWLNILIIILIRGLRCSLGYEPRWSIW